MYLGNKKIDPGSGMKLGHRQIDRIWFRNFRAWVNEYAPFSIFGLLASDNFFGKTTISWPHPEDRGVPKCTYDLYENDIKIATNVVSPYIRNVLPGTRTYRVRAVNIAGTSDSNDNDGISLKTLAPQADTRVEYNTAYRNWHGWGTYGVFTHRFRVYNIPAGCSVEWQAGHTGVISWKHYNGGSYFDIGVIDQYNCNTFRVHMRARIVGNATYTTGPWSAWKYASAGTYDCCG